MQTSNKRGSFEFGLHSYSCLYCRWADALKLATGADKPTDDWYTVVQELEKNQKRSSRSFQNIGENLLDAKEPEKRNSTSRSPTRSSTLFDTVRTVMNTKSDSKNKTLPRNYNASKFSSENQSWGDRTTEVTNDEDTLKHVSCHNSPVINKS